MFSSYTNRWLLCIYVFLFHFPWCHRFRECASSHMLYNTRAKQHWNPSKTSSAKGTSSRFRSALLKSVYWYLTENVCLMSPGFWLQDIILHECCNYFGQGQENPCCESFGYVQVLGYFLTADCLTWQKSIS